MRSRVQLAALDDVLIARARDAAGLAELSSEDYLVRHRLADRSPAGLVLLVLEVGRDNPFVVASRDPRGEPIEVANGFD